ncbi:MAG: helix-turn-helix domain-containing protein [Bacteroidales bacterium]|nr:helix-turn-helix domain-containing protein [Bacteroidales bacterium]
MIEYRTHEEMLDKHVGKKGSPERKAYDEEVKKGLEEYRIGEAIRQARKQQGLTQEELGRRMGVQRAQVSKLENGRNIAYASIIRAFKALGAETACIDLGKLGRVALW